MPTREQTIADAIAVFENATLNRGQNLDTAWLDIYQALLWYEPVNWIGIAELPHIIDADKLRPSSTARGRTWTVASPWQRRALSVAEYLAESLHCPLNDVPGLTNLLMKQPDYQMQRQNTLGIAFAGVAKHVLERFGSNAVSYQVEVEARTIFAGITFPGRSARPRIDLLVTRDNIPRAIISTKWSLRHDRLSDLTNECPIYKASWERIYRRGREHLLYYVLTNEYDPARLLKLINDPCLDGTVHVHKKAVVEVCGLNSRLANLMDLTDLVNETFRW